MTAVNRAGYGLVSADSHVIEPRDLFETRLPKHLRSRAPKMATSNGRSEWKVEGVGPVPLPASAATGSGFRLPKRDATRSGISFDEVLPALYDPAARLAAQDADSVDAEVLYGYPYLWDAIKQVDDGELRLACAETFNDWIAEFCRSAPARLFGIARIPTSSIEDARREMLRCRDELGLKGYVLDALPDGIKGAADPALDALWDVANEAGLAISLHYGLGDSRSAPTAAIAPGMKPPAAAIALPLASGGVFDRFPNLRMIFAHGDAGWSFHWMEFLDNTYQRQRHLKQFKLPNPDVYPSEYVRRHFWFTVQQDRSAVTARHMFGGDHLMWASHFPLDATNWPDNRQQAMRVTEELPEAERHAILAGNAARLYRFPGYEEGVAPPPFESVVRLVYV